MGVLSVRSLKRPLRATIRPMREITVTRATADEYGAIEALRADHYERMGCERIPVPSSACWFVALNDARVVACCAVMEREWNGPVFGVTDIYCEQTPTGRRGASCLLSSLEAQRGRVTGSIPVWNRRMLNALARSGYYPTAITMEKDTRA